MSFALSERELEILELAKDGFIDKEIALRMGISQATVATYWDRIRRKSGAKTRVQAVVIGLFHDQLQPDHGATAASPTQIQPN